MIDVAPDEEFEVYIQNKGKTLGDGITRLKSGYVVIVKDARQGERVKIRLTKVFESFAIAEVIERLKK